MTSNRAIRTFIKTSITISLLWLCAIENTDGIDRRAGVLERLGRLDGAVGDRRVKISLLRRHTVREQDHDLLPRRVAARVIVAAAHQRLCLLHAVGDIRRALRLRREVVDLGLERGLAGRAFRRVRFGRGHERPVHQRGSVRAESHDRDPVIRLFRVILIRHRFNECVHGLLHGILAARAVIARAFAAEIVRHRAGLVEHEHDVTRFDRGRRRHFAGRKRLHADLIAAIRIGCRRLGQVQAVLEFICTAGAHSTQNRLHRNSGQERAGRRIHNCLRRLDLGCGGALGRGIRGIVHNAGAEEQAHAQEHGRAEDERENAFFHVFVLLSQAVGIGSICVLEVLASTVPTCFHTSMGPYLSRFAVWTASAVT